MVADLLELYERASAWTLDKVAGATQKLDAATPCDGWDVRTLMNHMLQTQQYFVHSARDEKASLPMGTPPEIVGDDPVAAFTQARAETLRTFGEDGVIERTGPALGIAFSDQLLHGWDLAEATDQDPTMPAGLPDGGVPHDPRPLHGRAAQRCVQARAQCLARGVSAGQAAGLHRS